jgi:hypothetical protein
VGPEQDLKVSLQDLFQTCPTSDQSPSALSPNSRFGSATDIFGEKLALNLTDANRRIIKVLMPILAENAND